jgi:hypothetical protein
MLYLDGLEAIRVGQIVFPNQELDLKIKSQTFVFKQLIKNRN